MMMKFQVVVKGVALAGAVAFASTSVLADGMARRGLRNAPAPFSWTGFYVGVHAGFAWSDVNGHHDTGDVDGPFNFNRIDFDRALAGAQARYAFQTGQIILGAEVDYSFARHSDRAQGPDAPPGENFYRAKGGDLWSVRGLLGFTPIPKLLIYGTAGWGGTNFRLSVHDNSGPADGSISLRETGVVYGGGIELAVSDRISIKTEYLHYDVGARRDLTDPPIPDSDAGDFIKFDDVHVWRVGVNVKLDHFRREVVPLK